MFGKMFLGAIALLIVSSTAQAQTHRGAMGWKAKEGYVVHGSRPMHFRFDGEKLGLFTVGGIQVATFYGVTTPEAAEIIRNPGGALGRIQSSESRARSSEYQAQQARAELAKATAPWKIRAIAGTEFIETDGGNLIMLGSQPALLALLERGNKNDSSRVALNFRPVGPEVNGTTFRYVSTGSAEQPKVVQLEAATLYWNGRPVRRWGTIDGKGVYAVDDIILLDD